MTRTIVATIDAYIAAARPDVQPVLRKIRRLIRKAAPGAVETISYRIPAFRKHAVFLYFAAFKNHIGIFPPIFGDKTLDRKLQRYRGPKGNLQFPLDEPIPYDLIERIAALRAKQDEVQAEMKKKKTKRG